MNILAFDPGDTVGYAIVEEDGYIRAKGGFPIGAAAQWTSHIRGLGPIDEIVIESPPQNIKNHSVAWHTVEHWIEVTFPTAKVSRVSPGEWKPLKHILSREKDKFESDHEKDAVMLARFRARQLAVK